MGITIEAMKMIRGEAALAGGSRTKEMLLGGAVCASGARWGAGLYGGRRAFLYFPADVWIPHRVHRGYMADGLDLREERRLLFRQDSFCKSGGASGGVSFRDGVCVHHQ